MSQVSTFFSRLGQLQVGDEILGIDGIKMEGYSLQEAMKLVQEADSVIEMEVMFQVQDNAPPNSGTFDVLVKKKTATLNLGITINGSRSRGGTIWISNLRKGGIAYRSGMLHSGDVILAINSESLENCNLKEAAQILKNAGESITLKIGKESSPSTTTASSSAAAAAAIIFSVELHRNQQSLGITLKGSRDQAGHPVVIAKIKEDGVAHKTGTLKVGDRILAINGESLYNKTMPEAVHMLNSGEDVVSLKISKATRKNKSRHKSGSPTGRYRGQLRGEYGSNGGFPHHHPHRDSFRSNSSSSSFVGGMSGRGPRLTYNRPKYPFEGESASGYNTPDNLSKVSSVQGPPPPPPPLYAGQLDTRALGGNRLTSHRTEMSASAFSHVGNGGMLGPHAHQRYPLHWQFSPLDDDQISSVSSGRNRRSPYYPYPLEAQLSPKLQHMLTQKMSMGGGGGSSKRDSSTDDEMSAYELEGHMSTQRRASLPSKSPYPPQYSPHYPYTSVASGGGAVWDFKSRRHPLKPPIPIGRVTPITPTEPDVQLSANDKGPPHSISKGFVLKDEGPGPEALEESAKEDVLGGEIK